jgi:DNA polymerase III alpha subunit (gram-positive type)
VKCENPHLSQPQALEVIGRTRKQIATEGISKEKMVDLVNKFLEQDGKTRQHRVFAGHNVFAFDVKFIHALYKKCNQELQVDNWLDTKPFVKKFANEKLGIAKPKLTLGASLELLGIKARDGSHDAGIDTQNNYFLLKKLFESGIDHLDYIKNIPHILNDNI